MGDRPVECSHCKKPIHVIYKEIVGQSILCTEMCADCPIVQQKLHGQLHPILGNEGQKEAELYCGNCRTSLDSIKMGNPLGCSECYTVFGDLLVTELIAREHIPLKQQKTVINKKTASIHIGKSPEHPLHLQASTKLATLNEALGEALKKENYEQAAWIRDQINALKESPNERKD